MASRPSATDRVGHYPTAVEAATAFACALQARDEFIRGLHSDSQVPPALHALTSPDSDSFADLDVDTLLMDLPASGVT